MVKDAFLLLFINFVLGDFVIRCGVKTMHFTLFMHAEFAPLFSRLALSPFFDVLDHGLAVGIVYLHAGIFYRAP